MDSIGQYVKHLRETREITIEEVSNMTLLKVSSLELLEADEIEKLGGYGVVKSFASTVVRKLDGSAIKLNNILDASYPEFKTSSFRNIEYKAERKFLISTNWIYGFLIVIVVVVLSLFTYKTYKESNFNFFKARQEIVDQKEEVIEKVIIELPAPELRD